MKALRALLGLFLILTIAFVTPLVNAANFDVKVSTSASSTSNLFSDSTSKEDGYSTSTVDANWYPLRFARLNLVVEHKYYSKFINLSNLVYGGGLTIIPFRDSSRISTYLEGNFKKRRYHHTTASSNSLNPNEITGDVYDGTFGVGYRLSSRTQLRAGLSLSSTQYKIDGVIDRKKMDVTAGANTTLFGSYAIDLELGYSTGRYQYVNPLKLIKGVPEFGVPDTMVTRAEILPGEQYSILLTDRLRSFYISPRISRSLGRKTGLALTYSNRQFLDHDKNAVIYGYSTGYLSPWLGDFAGQAVVLKLKTYLIPRLITTFSAGFWEREHLRTVERELKPFGFLQELRSTVSLLYAQDRTDWRRRFDIKVQCPLQMGNGVTLEPSIQADYTDNNSTVLVYKYDDFSVNAGVTVRF